MKEMRDVTQSCRIRIDKDGRWYYEDNEIVNPLVLRSFCQALDRDGNGRYRIILDSELCYVEVEDTPFVVSAIRGDPQCGLFLRLNTMETHPLDPDKLCFGDDNVLYVILPDGSRARFTRPAYYSLAFMMEEDECGNIVLSICDKIYQIYPRSKD